MASALRKGEAARENASFCRLSNTGFRRFWPWPRLLALFFFCYPFSALILSRGDFLLFAQAGEAAAARDSLPAFSVQHEAGAAQAAAPDFSLQTWFWHDIQLYVWQSQLRMQHTLASHWQLQVLGNLNSVLQPLASGDLWKDDHQAGVQLARPLPGSGRVEVLAEARVFRDALTGSGASDFSNNDFSSARLRVNHEWQMASRLLFAPSLGYRWEEILNRREHGPAAGFTLTLRPTVWAQYAHQFDALAHVENLPERRNEDVSVLYGVSRQFQGNATDSLLVRFNHLRRENYFTIEYVDLVQRNRRALENRLHYRLNGAWRFFVYSEIGEAGVEVARRTLATANAPAVEVSRFRHDDLESSHFASLVFEKKQSANEFSFYYRSRRRAYEMPDSLRSSPLIRRYASEGYDSDWWDLAVSHRLQWRLGRSDSLRWYGRVTRYALTTANLEDPNDHDRLQFQFNLLYVRRFNRAFSMGWEGRSYLEHHVYLKKNLSGDNRWMRIWQLLPYVLFEPAANVKFKQTFGVRATYIDYDFPEALARRRSIVFRDFFLADSLTLPLSSRTTATLQYKFAVEERGLLDWERWLQNPQVELQRHWAMVSFGHRWSSRWEFFPGVSFYRETNWKYQLRPDGGWLKIFNGDQTIVRPTLQLSYVRPPAVLLLLHWRQQINFRTLPDKRLRRDPNIDTFNLTIQWAW